MSTEKKPVIGKPKTKPGTEDPVVAAPTLLPTPSDRHRAPLDMPLAKPFPPILEAAGLTFALVSVRVVSSFKRHVSGGTVGIADMIANLGKFLSGQPEKSPPDLEIVATVVRMVEVRYRAGIGRGKFLTATEIDVTADVEFANLAFDAEGNPMQPDVWEAIGRAAIDELRASAAERVTDLIRRGIEGEEADAKAIDGAAVAE